MTLEDPPVSMEESEQVNMLGINACLMLGGNSPPLQRTSTPMVLMLQEHPGRTWPTWNVMDSKLHLSSTMTGSSFLGMGLFPKIHQHLTPNRLLV